MAKPATSRRNRTGPTQWNRGGKRHCPGTAYAIKGNQPAKPSDLNQIACKLPAGRGDDHEPQTAYPETHRHIRAFDISAALLVPDHDHRGKRPHSGKRLRAVHVLSGYWHGLGFSCAIPDCLDGQAGSSGRLLNHQARRLSVKAAESCLVQNKQNGKENENWNDLGHRMGLLVQVNRHP